MHCANGTTAMAVLTAVPLSTNFGWYAPGVFVTFLGLICVTPGCLVWRNHPHTHVWPRKPGPHGCFTAWAYWTLSVLEGVQKYTSLGPQ